MNAIGRLLTNIEAIQNGRNTRQALIGAGRELDDLLPELEDLSSVLERAIIVQSPAVVTAHLDRLRLLGESMRRDVQTLSSGICRTTPRPGRANGTHTCIYR